MKSLVLGPFKSPDGDAQVARHSRETRLGIPHLGLVTHMEFEALRRCAKKA